MKNYFDFPRPLIKRILYTPSIGLGCLILGIVFGITSSDRIIVLLSAAIFIASIGKGMHFYHIANKRGYEVVTGTCTGISAKPFRKNKDISVVDRDGVETTLRISKQNKVKIGGMYHFYFLRTVKFPDEYKHLTSALVSDSFLGFEQVAEPE